MSHNFLFDSYEYLHKRLDKVHPELTTADADQSAKQFTAGQIDALCTIERFLKERYDGKLPRRLRRIRQQAGAMCK